MANIFITHGSYSNPNENWFPWLKAELERVGHKVVVPKFPTPAGQTLDNWLRIFAEHEKSLDENSVVIGHSVGTTFLLHVIENSKKPIKAAFFISGWLGLLNLPTYDKIVETFTCRDFDWQKIKSNCKKFYIFHSDNDPYVPLAKGEEIAKNLGIEVTLVKNAGHFNEKAGYRKFDSLLDMIKSELKNNPEKESISTMFASEEVLKKDWNNEADERWNK